LGSLPGTLSGYGTVVPNDVTADGSVVVGGNGFDWSQWAAFIWTEGTGMVDVDDFLTDNGVPLPPGFDIQSLVGISDNGEVMVGFGQDTYAPFTPRSFVILNLSTGIEEQTAEAVSLRLKAFPNPTRGGTTLAFNMPVTAIVNVKIYDVSGRLIRRIAGEEIQAGPHELSWDGIDASGAKVPSGMYFCRLEAGGQRETQKLTVLR
ncbi:MAG: T9SS type A sorting domain-containing protein, partial [Gemmatimonadota bacterium]